MTYGQDELEIHIRTWRAPLACWRAVLTLRAAGSSQPKFFRNSIDKSIGESKSKTASNFNYPLLNHPGLAVPGLDRLDTTKTHAIVSQTDNDRLRQFGERVVDGGAQLGEGQCMHPAPLISSLG